MVKIVTTLAEFEAEATRFAGSLRPQEQGATLVTLSGELGAGKTAFTKAVAHTLGVESVVTSPTFVLEKIYQLPSTQAFGRLVHIDAYRLEAGKDLKALGFDEVLQDASNLILLEWPEMVADALPASAVSITLKVIPSGGRNISYDKED